MTTYDWQLSKALGAARLSGQTLANAATGSALGTAMCLKWAFELVGAGAVAATNWSSDQKVVETQTTNTATFLATTIGPKRFTDALPLVGAKFVDSGFDVALDGALQDLSESKLTKAIDSLADDGRYVLFAVEKTRHNAFWYPLAIGCTKKTCTVLDPYAGQFTTKKSSDVAKYLISQLATNKTVSANVDGFLLLKVTLNKLSWIRNKLVGAAASTTAKFAQLTQTELATEPSKTYFGRDFVRYLVRYRLVSGGKVLHEHLAPIDGKSLLKQLVTALGGGFTVPEDANAYDAEINGGKMIEEAVAAQLKKTDGLFKVMTLVAQRLGVSYFQEWRMPMGFDLPLMPRQINYNMDGFATRFNDHDVMWFDIVIDPNHVKITTHIGFCEGVESPFRYRGWVHLENEFDRKAGTTKSSAPRIEVALA